LVLTAHLDHPGFVVEAPGGERPWARWLGGVDRAYFLRSRVRAHWRDGSGRERSAVGEILETCTGERGRVGRIRIRFREAVPPGAIGTWDVPAWALRGETLRLRAADDLLGCAAITLAVEALWRRRPRLPLWAVFTRAEEVGLVGATALARSRGLPAGALVVVLETSKELPGARRGEGPVLRVGDRQTVFDAALTWELQRVAEALRRETRGFRFQRRLMDGGVCEASSFGVFGYRAAGLALPLGNYHNMGRKGPAPELIHRQDLRCLVAWLVALGMGYRVSRTDGLRPGDPSRLEALLRRHRGELLRTATLAHQRGRAG
jgi:endoglucanase